MTEFTKPEEDQLINIVSQNPVLYDTNHEEYRNIPHKESLWQQIAEELGKTSEDCKKKWKFVRDGYKRFMRRHPVGSAMPKYSKNCRHRQLSFLDGYSFAEVEVVIKNEGHSDTDPIGFEHEESGAISKSTDSEMASSDENLASQRSQIAEQSKPLKKTKVKRLKKEESLLKQWKDSEERTQGLIKTLIKRKDDDVEHFCRHIAQVLRKLPALERAQAKKHLGAVLSEYEIAAAKNLKKSD